MNTPTSKPSFSVAVPVYKCGGCLQQLCERLENTLKQLTDRYEIILVDDRSPDGAWIEILALQDKHPAVRGVRLSRNFGQQIAITAGLAVAKGDFVAVMDCDLQDPPEMLAELYAKMLEGYDIVISRRATRGHSWLRKTVAAAYFSVLSKVMEEKIDGNFGSSSLLRRKVVDAFLQFSERERHYIFVLRWLGFQLGTIDYEQSQRASGTSAYTLGKLLRHAMEGLFFQTTALLRWILGLGLLFALGSMFLAVGLLAQEILIGAVPGWTSLAVLILASTGVILVSLGVVGLYIGKVFDQIKGRPLYIVDTVAERHRDW